MNRVLWPGGNCVKSGEQHLRWIPDYKPPPLPLLKLFFYTKNWLVKISMIAKTKASFQPCQVSLQLHECIKHGQTRNAIQWLLGWKLLRDCHVCNFPIETAMLCMCIVKHPTFSTKYWIVYPLLFLAHLLVETSLPFLPHPTFVQLFDWHITTLVVDLTDKRVHHLL